MLGARLQARLRVQTAAGGIAESCMYKQTAYAFMI